EAEVDRNTGWITVPRVWIAHDIGRAINPVNARGQVEGSVYMGLGEALMEEQVFRRLPPKLSRALVHKIPSLLEYKSLTSLDMPEVFTELVEDPDPNCPFGAKEVGQGPLLPVMPAVAKILAAEGPQAMLIAGGTDLLPNMKRRHQTPATLVSLRQIEALKNISNGSHTTLGAGLTLNEIVANAKVREQYAVLWQAAAQVATVHLRNMGTLGGNLCLDTRCNYYNQNYEWRKAIDFCMKKDGEICWVATASKRCVATSSTDTAPALISLGASVRVVSAQGERDVALADFYRNDGIDYLTRRPDEILTEVKLPAAEGWKSSYWKL